MVELNGPEDYEGGHQEMDCAAFIPLGHIGNNQDESVTQADFSNVFYPT